MFQFHSKFLKPTTAATVVPDAAKPTTTNHFRSRLLKERQAKKCANKPQDRTLPAPVLHL